MARALEGIKVADFGRYIAGPLTGAYLGEHGATVVKVESHARLDMMRGAGPFSGKSNINSSGAFALHNSSKLSVTINFKKQRGRELALALIKWADVVIESERPGIMNAFGLSYEHACKVKPDIIYMSTTMWGPGGPECFRPAFGQLGCAGAGIYYLSGWPDRGPAAPEGAYLDFIAPRFCTLAVLAALDYRRRTGRGQRIDVAQVETGIQFTAPAIMEYTANGRITDRKGDWLTGAAPHGAFRCKGTEQWVAIGIHSDSEWRALCRAMGDPPWSARFDTLLARRESEPELRQLVEEWTIRFTPAEVTRVLQDAGIPCGHVERISDLFADAQLRDRGYFRWFDHPVMGKCLQERRAFKLSATPETQFVAPTIGQHNDHVYREILGLSDDEIADLMVEGVITTEADLPREW